MRPREKPPELLLITLSIVIFIRPGSDSLLTVTEIHSPAKEEAPCQRAYLDQEKREDEQRTRSPGSVSKCPRIIYEREKKKMTEETGKTPFPPAHFISPWSAAAALHSTNTIVS